MVGDMVMGATMFCFEVGLDIGLVYGLMIEMIYVDDMSGMLFDWLVMVGVGLFVVMFDGIVDGSL